MASGRTSVSVGAHLADIGGEGACVNLIAGGAEAHQRGGNSLVVASSKPLYHTFERLPGLGRYLTHNPEVYEGYSAIAQHQQVTRMHICVEGAAASPPHPRVSACLSICEHMRACS
jgi:hypothetical protein